MEEPKYIKSRVKEINKNENYLPTILFYIVLINFLSLFILNCFTKKSVPAGVGFLVPGFGVGFIILLNFYKKKIKTITKDMAIEFILLCLITLMWSIIQVINLISGEYYLFDTLNIACKFANVLFLFILLIDFKVREKSIYDFMELLIKLGIIACIWNFILYFKDILAIFKIIPIVSKVNPKSFFAQKNQFAYYLFTCIVSCVFLFVRNDDKEQKKRYASYVLLFLFNIILANSRTAFVISVLFLGLYLIFNNIISKEEKKKYFKTIVVVGILLLLFLCVVNPEFIKEHIRIKSIGTLTGRTKIWDVALGVASESKASLIFGAGRFKGIEIINRAKLNFTQFHNTYIEFLVSGGIVELVYFISIYVYVINKIIKSATLYKEYKVIYGCMYFSFFIYMVSESLGRFSIGGSDVLGLIFFVTIPLLFANSVPDRKRLNGTKEPKGEKIQE